MFGSRFDCFVCPEYMLAVVIAAAQFKRIFILPYFGHFWQFLIFKSCLYRLPLWNYAIESREGDWGGWGGVPAGAAALDNGVPA